MLFGLRVFNDFLVDNRARYVTQRNDERWAHCTDNAHYHLESEYGEAAVAARRA